MMLACLLLGLLGTAAPRQDPDLHRAVAVVLDVEGRPLPGVPIAVDARLGVVPGSFEPALETDAEGRFQLAWTPSRESYWIDLVVGGGPGLSSCKKTLLPSAADANGLIDLGPIPLTRGDPLDLRLVDPSGLVLCEGWAVELELGAGMNGVARADLEAGLFRLDCVPRGSFTVRVLRRGEPGPCHVGRVDQDGTGDVLTFRVVSRRQIWVRVELPYPEGVAVPGSLVRGLSVLAVTPEQELFEAIYDPATGLYLLDGLPAGPLDLRVVGPPVLRLFEARLPERGLVTARLRGALDLEVVLLEQGSAGAITEFVVEATSPGVEVRELTGGLARSVEGLVSGVGRLELHVPGADRPRVVVDLADLTPEEVAARRVVRTLPNWTAVRGKVVDETGRGDREAIVLEIRAVDARGDEGPERMRHEIDRGGDYRFSSLVPGPHVVRVWWAERHWQDYPVVVGGKITDRDVHRETPAILSVLVEGAWPDELGLVVHHAGAPEGYPAVTTLRPTSEGLFGPYELAPGEVDLAVACHGSMRTWPLERITVEPGSRSRRIDRSTLPALVSWRVRVDGASVAAACRGEVRPRGATGGTEHPVRLGTAGARKDAMLVEAVDSELTLTSEDETWSAHVDLTDLRPGEVREVPVEVSRARRRVRILVDGEPLQQHEIRVEVRTRKGILLRQKRHTDADGEVDLMFVPGVLTVFGVGSGRDPVDHVWSEDPEPGTLEIELR